MTAGVVDLVLVQQFYLELFWGIQLVEVLSQWGKIHPWPFSVSHKKKAILTRRKILQNYGLDACVEIFFVSISARRIQCENCWLMGLSSLRNIVSVLSCIRDQNKKLEVILTFPRVLSL